jgi:hypothetical protein
VLDQGYSNVKRGKRAREPDQVRYTASGRQSSLQALDGSSSELCSVPQEIAPGSLPA